MTDNMPDTGQESPQEKDVAAPHAKKFVSRGWWIHNETTYRGLNWILNSTLGVSFTYWSKVTESGQAIFTRPVTGFFKKLLKPLLAAKNLENGAGWGTEFVGIMIGGFSVIPLVMLMENKKNKKRIVKWLDEKWYGKEVVATDPKFEESYRSIDKEPEKKFWVGMITRFISLAPLLALTVYPTTQRWLKSNLYNRIGKSTQWLVEKIGVKPTKMMTESIMVDGKPKLKWDHLHYLIGFDFGLTFFYAFIHEFTYKALAAVGIKQNKVSNRAINEAQPASEQTLPQESVKENTMSISDPTTSAASSLAEKFNSAKTLIEKAGSHIDSLAASRAGSDHLALS